MWWIVLAVLWVILFVIDWLIVMGADPRRWKGGKQ